ncbi:protein of unknown function [Oenococcus oeni]|nr:hypothetical protein OENI_20062 [Oenococcus oeni]SYW00260.1 hypothetical protein OENI_20298 [Oenococcus oeni]SYW17632.1 hypothetical protein OENI_10300 [Oenococcus oeni]VDC14643.1 protein of unknown function [Oenococcus oeni]
MIEKTISNFISFDNIPVQTPNFKTDKPVILLIFLLFILYLSTF